LIQAKGPVNWAIWAHRVKVRVRVLELGCWYPAAVASLLLLELRRSSANPRRRQSPAIVAGHRHPHASIPILFAFGVSGVRVWQVVECCCCCRRGDLRPLRRRRAAVAARRRLPLSLARLGFAG